VKGVQQQKKLVKNMGTPSGSEVFHFRLYMSVTASVYNDNIMYIGTEEIVNWKIVVICLLCSMYSKTIVEATLRNIFIRFQPQSN
jgi:hypothetical protein